MYLRCSNFTCRTTFLVMGEEDEQAHAVGEYSEFWPDKHMCPKCGQRMQLSDQPSTHTQILEPQEARIALLGLGMPEELPCTQENVRRVLTESPVTYVHTSLARGSDRVYVEYLVLRDGTRIYFGATTHGACALRIVKPRRHTGP